jgi:Ca2+-binding RTX toxin-like protein
VTFTLATAPELENLQLTGSAAINGTGNDGANIIGGNAGANKLTGGEGADTIDGGLGNDIITGGRGADTIDVSKGNDRLIYADKLDSGDVVTGFDSNATGGQDQVNLDLLLDSLNIAAKDRATRVEIADTGADTEIRVDADDNGSFEIVVATLTATDATTVTVGADVILGS